MPSSFITTGQGYAVYPDENKIVLNGMDYYSESIGRMDGEFWRMADDIVVSKRTHCDGSNLWMNMRVLDENGKFRMGFGMAVRHGNSKL